jgi:hypothetical protein
MTINPESLTVLELLQSYYEILDELRARNIVRTSNSPIGDYAEWLVAKQLGLSLVTNSTSCYDAIDSEGVRYQIKGRRIAGKNRSRQLSAIRNLINHDFDYLIVVILNEHVRVEKVLKIPHEIIGRYASYREHVNAHILVLQNNILANPLTEDITFLFRDY